MQDKQYYDKWIEPIKLSAIFISTEEFKKLSNSMDQELSELKNEAINSC
jgi:hypothetical protein